MGASESQIEQTPAE